MYRRLAGESEIRLQSFLFERSIRFWQDRRKELDLHLLPGYGFVSTSLRERGRLPPVAGVVQFVPFDGQPRRSRNTGSKALAGLWGRLGLQPHSYLKLGRQVPVRSRPLAGREEILMYRKRSFTFYWLRPGRAGTIHEIHRSLALARCVSEPGHVRLQSQTSRLRLPRSAVKPRPLGLGI